ncbi:hypothetical protein LEMLEM_LOCUS2976 [Lemmus lemmus]
MSDCFFRGSGFSSKYPTWWLTTSSSGPSSLFWLPRTPGIQVVQTHMQAPALTSLSDGL